MDPQRFDRITIALAASGTRRALVRRLAVVPVVGGLVTFGAAPLLARRGRGRRRDDDDGDDGDDDDDGFDDPGCNIECCMNCYKRPDYFLGRIRQCIDAGQKTCEACGRWTGCLGFIETGTRCGRVLATCGS
jgi:hypothetical protein